VDKSRGKPTVRGRSRSARQFGVNSFLSHSHRHASKRLGSGKDCVIDAISGPFEPPSAGNLGRETRCQTIDAAQEGNERLRVVRRQL